MEFSDIVKRAVAIRARYAAHEQRQFGRAWTTTELALGYMGDVGDLAKLVMAAAGVRQIPDVEARLAHELADCLWAVIALAEAHNVDLEKAFLSTMDDLEAHLGAP